MTTDTGGAQVARHEPMSHCDACGTRYEIDADRPWPRRCGNCGGMAWFNPTPISVMLQRVWDGSRVGIATPIRGHQPMRGRAALTGGFTDGWDQSSEDGGSREINEEIGLPRVDRDDAILLMTQATGPFIPKRRQLLTFSISPRVVGLDAFDDWRPDAETMAMHYSWKPEVLAFPSHTRALALYFSRHQGVEAPPQYLKQPKTGDAVRLGSAGDTVVFEVPYDQPTLDDGTWQVLLEDGGAPTGVRWKDGRWTV